MEDERTEAPGQITLQQRSIAAGGASVVAALVTNPLDVVKTRMQAQLGARLAAQSGQPGSTLFERWAITSCSPSCTNLAEMGRCRSYCYVYDSTYSTLVHIVRKEGVHVLWRGTSAALLMAVPMVGIYMPLYDLLSEQWKQQLGGYAPAAAGVTSRTLSVLATAPLELLRTRLQAQSLHAAAAAAAAAAAPPLQAAASVALPCAGRMGVLCPYQLTLALPASPGMRSAAASCVARSATCQRGSWHEFQAMARRWWAPACCIHAQGARPAQPCGLATSASRGGRMLTSWAAHGGGGGEGPRPSLLRRALGMYRGVDAQLARDLPFSALYWAMLEPLRAQLVASDGQQRSNAEVLRGNMVAGAIAGGTAAAVTTPLDVVKTQVQLHAHHASSWQATVDLVNRGGLRGLFVGVGPRATRAAPACAIVIGCYEWLKAVLSDRM